LLLHGPAPALVRASRGQRLGGRCPQDRKRHCRLAEGI